MDHHTTTLHRQQQLPSHGQRRECRTPEPLHVLIATKPDGSRVIQTRTDDTTEWGPEIPALSVYELHPAGEVPC